MCSCVFEQERTCEDGGLMGVHIAVEDVLAGQNLQPHSVSSGSCQSVYAAITLIAQLPCERQTYRLPAVHAYCDTATARMQLLRYGPFTALVHFWGSSRIR
jgi:hypothetical protein